jgi:hypothetical protein
MEQINKVLFSRNRGKTAALTALAKEDANHLNALIHLAQNSDLVAAGHWHMAIEALEPLAPTHEDVRDGLKWIAENDPNRIARMMATEVLAPLAPTDEAVRDGLKWIAENDDDDYLSRLEAIRGLVPLAATHPDVCEMLERIAEKYSASDDSFDQYLHNKASAALESLARQEIADLTNLYQLTQVVTNRLPPFDSRER